MAQEFKIKDLAKLDLKDGQKQEVEVEGLEDAKVLLVNVKGKVSGLSPKCTHYGAPLAKGTLAADGRLTCPWHGACFSTATGAVEDAPALDPLITYEVVEKSDGVYVKGSEKDLKGGFTTLNLKCSAHGEEKVLVVGGGSGTTGAIEGLRSGGFKGPITVLSKESLQPIDRTKLSKALLADVGKLAWRSQEYYKDSSIDINQEEVKEVDFKAKKVSTTGGKTYDYTKLILATGGTARWLPLEGLKGDLGNVFVLRTLEHTQKILDAVGDNGKKVVVIGSSFIGMEVANCLVGKKNDVTVVGMEKVPLERVMGEKLGASFQKLLEKNGVKFHMSAGVDKATPSKSDSSKAGAVHLKDGTVLEADLVILGVGVSPATEYLKNNSAVELLKDGSIKTDDKFAVEGLTDVFAIGDIATHPYHGPGGEGKPVRIEHWNVAQNGGRTVAKVITKPNEKPQPFIPVFWSALGAQLRYCGNTMNGYDDMILNGDTEKPSWVAYYTKGETVVAVASMMKDPYMVQSAELMRTNKMPTKSELQKGVDIMQIGIPAL